MVLSLRLRRALALSSATIHSTATAFRKPHPHLSARPTPTLSPFARPHPRALSPRPYALGQCLSFRSSPTWFDRRGDSGEGKIGPDEILFEGCDYNHWLITMDFPKDPKPTPEQMVETYVETLAKVVGSREEAMKRMYACSTTTYHGFQAVMSEEMSEKFRGLPGVVFILPDSYIDPVNKEYGGDKYEMGKITPRPPPVQYGRQGRYNDRNRNYDRPRYDRPRDSMSMQQGNAAYDRQGPMQHDNRSYAPHQQYGSTGQQGPPQSYGRQPLMQGPGPNYTPPQNQYPTSQQGESSYYHRDLMQNDANANQQSYGQPSHFSGRRDHTPRGSDNYQAERSPTPEYNMNVSQGEQGNYGGQEHGGFPRGQYEGYYKSYTGIDYRQGRTPGSGQNARPGEAQSFPVIENKNQGQ